MRRGRTIVCFSQSDDAIRADGVTVVHSAVPEILLRLAETHLLCHPRMVRLVQVWDGIVGSAPEKIKDHLTELLGAAPSQELVTHFFRCLSGSASQRGRRRRGHVNHFGSVLRRIREETSAEDLFPLRCECCGYHFRTQDLSDEKLQNVVDAGFTLDRSFFPGRSNDPYKPIKRSHDDYWTTLSIDHVIPEETLGWSESDNLEILCLLCNAGKLTYRRPLEALSVFAVGALADVPRGRRWNALKHHIIIAALRSQGGCCSQCGRHRQKAELTVRPIERGDDQSMHGFAPWNLQTICYVCVNDSMDEEEFDNEEDRIDQPES